MRIFSKSIVAAALVFCWSLAVHAFPVTVDHLIATLEAEKLEKSEAWEEAALAYEGVFAGDNGNIHAYKKSGDMWLKAGNNEKAVLVYEKLINNKAYTDLALRALAGIYGRAGDVEKAISYLSRYQEATQRGLLKTLLTSSDFEAVRDDAAFKAFIRKENAFKQPRSEWHPTWSPDGKRIAFAMQQEGESSFDIYTIDPAGADLRRLTQTYYNETMLKWSPAGNEIVFVRSGRDFPTPHGIYAINPDTGEERAVITVASDLDSLPRGFGSPNWCPDASCIVFIGLFEGVLQLFRIESDGTNLVQLSNSPEYGKGNPSISPDGSKACFDVNRDGEWAHQNLYVIECVPMDGSMKGEVILTDRYWWQPVWSWDGSIFMAGLWESVEDRFGRIAIVDLDNDELHYITPPEMDSWWQTISPDNTQVVFGASQTPFGNDKRLYIMNLDGSDMRLLIP